MGDSRNPWQLATQGNATLAMARPSQYASGMFLPGANCCTLFGRAGEVMLQSRDRNRARFARARPRVASAIALHKFGACGRGWPHARARCVRRRLPFNIESLTESGRNQPNRLNSATQGPPANQPRVEPLQSTPCKSGECSLRSLQDLWRLACLANDSSCRSDSSSRDR